jgi:hypothetical protein
MVSNGKDSIIPSTRWQLSDKIEGYSFERGCSRFWSDQIQRGLWLCSEGFGSLTHAIPLHIFSDITSNGWLPVIPGNGEHGFGDSGVFCSGEIVVEGNYPPPKAIMTHHNKMGTKGPVAIGKGEAMLEGESLEGLLVSLLLLDNIPVKVPGTFRRPKFITIGSNCPFEVLNPALCWSPSLIQILWYPD